MLVVDHADFAGWVELLGDPLRARHAYWHLVISGDAALRAVRSGLRHPNADVRDYCTRALDRLVDSDAMPELIGMLKDSDSRVRADALHALACDRCKATDCRPEKDTVLNAAIGLLSSDPDKYVRAMAVEVVGRWVHTDPIATATLVAARDQDRESSVRKKAGWYAPGGTIFNKTAPHPPRRRG